MKFFPRDLWNDSGIFFLIALMGWMPTAIDLSAGIVYGQLQELNKQVLDPN